MPIFLFQNANDECTISIECSLKHYSNAVFESKAEKVSHNDANEKIQINIE